MDAPRERQIAWLEKTRAELLKLADAIDEESDVMLPRGFALGRTANAACRVRQAADELKDAISERKR